MAPSTLMSLNNLSPNWKSEYKRMRQISYSKDLTRMETERSTLTSLLRPSCKLSRTSQLKRIKNEKDENVSHNNQNRSNKDRLKISNIHSTSIIYMINSNNRHYVFLFSLKFIYLLSSIDFIYTI